MDDIHREVEDELLRDKYRKFIRVFGPYIFSIFIFILFGIGITEYLKHKGRKQASIASGLYSQALDLFNQGKPKESLDLFEALPGKVTKGYESLSQLMSASILQEENKLEKAIISYTDAGNGFSEKSLSELSRLKAAYAAMEVESPEQVLKRLEPLSRKGAPFEFLARELKASLAFKNGNYQEAKKEYGLLSYSPKVPDTIRARANEVLSLLKQVNEQQERQNSGEKKNSSIAEGKEEEKK